MKNTWITVISEITEIDDMEGIESLAYYVSNRPDIDSFEEENCMKFWSKDDAYNYAHKLNDKFKTADIVENWG